MNKIYLQALPKIRQEDVKVWDYERDLCGGYLNKKASVSSTFRKGKWQKRWVVMDTHALEDDENYFISYFHNPEDTKPRQSFPLANTSLLMSGGNSFTLTFADDSNIVLGADNNEQMHNWVDTIEKAISIATDREKKIIARLTKEAKLKEQRDAKEKFLGTDDYSETDSQQISNSPNRRNKSNNNSPNKHNDFEVEDEEDIIEKKINPFLVKRRESPSVRLDIDIQTIPPTSTERRRFEEMLINDLAKALRIDIDMIEILSIKPSIGMDWLTVVEFDVYVFPQQLEQDEYDLLTEEREEEMEMERKQTRLILLETLHSMIVDLSSPIYNGFISCKIDSTFSNNIIPDSKENKEINIFSADSKVLDIMNRYKDIELPIHNIDISHFTIFLHFEGVIRPLSVPNPLILRRRNCNIWPFEITQALGLMNTMQELFLTPKTLIPKDMPKSLSLPIHFEECARLNGAVAINSSHLKADLTYDVIMEDLREEYLENLTEEEKDTIKETFDQYDLDGDGGIMKREMEELIRIRVQDRKDIIEIKFREFISEPGLTEQDIKHAEVSKKLHFQHISESQGKLYKMFDAADTNGDGILSFTEFMLAEAWWLRCTLNPENAHMF